MSDPRLTWYWVSADYATFGVGVGPDGKVWETAPIAGWAHGKSWTAVSRFFRVRKGATIVAL